MSNVLITKPPGIALVLQRYKYVLGISIILEINHRIHTALA